MTRPSLANSFGAFGELCPVAPASPTIDLLALVDFHYSLPYLNAPISGFLINETPTTSLQNMNAKPLPTLSEEQRAPELPEIDLQPELTVTPSLLLLVVLDTRPFTFLFCASVSSCVRGGSELNPL